MTDLIISVFITCIKNNNVCSFVSIPQSFAENFICNECPLNDECNGGKILHTGINRVEKMKELLSKEDIGRIAEALL